MISKNKRKTEMFGLLLACLSLVLLPWPTSSAEFYQYPTRYDAPIKAATAKWWLDLPDWKLWKSQLWQESHLDPDARSDVGAEGVAQFMPLSWQDQIKALGYPKTASRRDAALAIEAGAYYMRTLRRTWHRNRGIQDINDLAMASYNAGTGNILKAQKLCADAKLWHDISSCIGRVTGPLNAKQTIDYVVKIHRWRQQMEIQR